MITKLEPMDTAPRDGSEIILITKIGIVSARYHRGRGWIDVDPEGTREYAGPEWACYDEAFVIEIEETDDGEVCEEVLGWLPMITVGIRR